MTKRQGRLFFIICTLISATVFIGLTFDSHRRFPGLTNEDKLTPEIIRGKDVWHNNNCINCHTLLGEGGYYAPDLTKITQQRGTPYLTAFLKDPSQFYSEEKHRRLMPNPKLSDAEISEVIAFLDWVGHIDNQGWPPRPIIVSGTTIPGTDVGQPPTHASVSTDPVAQGEALFRSSPPACNACHSIASGANLAGPTLAGLATRAAAIIASPEYKGEAKTPTDYIRESITHPSAYLVPGAMYSANSQSFMPDNFAADLEPQQIDSLVAYLETLK
ncbi:nitric oxide reductase, NorC subunit apoprotein [Nitrosospira multiformis]|uniref:Nitric oxide reductase, NorC subunit apoprotein n=1 Tax=Nitrosospira multiformis TaxID=1231 RepID=A0A1I0ENP7_9PROT|nr:c-type cytochrome [Nitrosospira multiformis]SET46832.1 nitric oxide reductase, NorC subunit apoprotein [Nitrosospira multiformis]